MTTLIDVSDPEGDNPDYVYEQEFEVSVDALAEYFVDSEIMDPDLKPYRRRIIDGMSAVLIEHFTDKQLQRVVDGLDANDMFKQIVYDANNKLEI